MFKSQLLKIQMKPINTTFPILFFLLLSHASFGQQKQFSLPLHLAENVEFYVDQIETPKCLKFDMIQISEDTVYDEIYRFETEGQFIEITRKDGVISSHVINYVYKYKADNTDYSRPIFTKSIIQRDTSKMLYDRLQIFDSIPDMTRIKGWNRGHDGSNFTIESGTKEKYSLKSYWTPSVQNDSILFKNELISFVDFLLSLDSVNRTSQILMNQLKKGSYTDGGFGILLVPDCQKK